MGDYVERRQTPRIGVRGALIIESVTPGQSLQLLEVGMGGFKVSSAAPVEVGETAAFRFVAPNKHWSVVLRACAAYCRPMQDDRETPLFVSGYSFVGLTAPIVQSQLMTLMDMANPVTYS